MARNSPEQQQAEPTPILLYSSQVALTYWLCRAPGQPGVGLVVARGGTNPCAFSSPAAYFSAPDKQSVPARSQGFLPKSVGPLRMESCGLETSRLRSITHSLVIQGSSRETFKSGQVMYFEKVAAGEHTAELLQRAARLTHPATGGGGTRRTRWAYA